MAEPNPGRGQGQARTSADVTAGFKVDPSSIKELSKLWGQLVKHVKDFNDELKKINPRTIDAAAQATARLHGASKGAPAGTRPSTVNAGHTTPYQGRALHPSYVAGGGHLPGGSGGAGQGAQQQQQQRTARQIWKEEFTPRRLVGAGIAGIALYGGSHKQNMMDAERLAQYSSWGMKGRSEQNNEDIRKFWFGGKDNQGVRHEGLTGMQNTPDALAGIATLQANIGYGMGANQRQMYTGAGRIGNLVGSYEAGARVQSNLASTSTFYSLMSLGIQTRGKGGKPAEPEAIAKQFLMSVYGGKMPTEEEVAAGLQQGMPLRASMDAYQLDPETQEWIGKYGMLSGKIGALGGDNSVAGMKKELGKTGGATKEGKSAIGATAFDAQRRTSQKQAEVEQEIADHALPAMRTAFNTMTGVLDEAVIPLLTALGGALGAVVGTVAGGGAALGGTASAINGFGGGMLGSMAAAAFMNRRGGGRGGGGGGGGGGGPTPRPRPPIPFVAGLARAGGALRYGLAGGAGFLAGGMASDAVGGGYLGAGLQGAATLAGVGAMAGAPFGAPGMAVGAAGGAVIGAIGGTAIHGIGKLFGGGDKGGGNDSAAYGSREEIDVVNTSLASRISGSMRGRSGGTSDSSSSNAEGEEALAPEAGTGPVTGGTARGAEALAWMLSQHKNPSKSWKNLCLQDVRLSLGVGKVHPDANTAWYHTKKRHQGTPPPGVPVWWTGGYGHVALSAGGGYVWSNDILRDGKIDKVTIDYINKKWGKPYKGWTEDINGVDVYDGAAVAAAVGETKKSTVSGGGAAATTRSGKGASISAAKSYARSRLAAFGWGDGEWEALEKLWQKESEWKSTAQNLESSAYGIAQFVDRTWAGVGAKKTADPFRQIDAGLKYIQQRYNTPSGAWAFWNRRVPIKGKDVGNWYGDGAILTGAQVIGVGERGPEAVIPLDERGVKVLTKAMVQYANRDKRNGKALDRAVGHGTVQVTLNMPIQLAQGHGPADASKLVKEVVRALETDRRLAAVMAGD